MADTSRELTTPAATGGLISAEQQRAIAEVQARMLLARSNPRDPDRALDIILKDCTRLSLAEDACYEFARGGTEIRGASIRLAEAIATRWGNLASGIKILDRQDDYTELSAFAWDMETNFIDERQFRVRHIRQTRRGSYRLTDERDIYEMEANQGQRRKRSALLTVIPRDIVEAAIKQCDVTLLQHADLSPEGLQKLVEAFAKFGITKLQIEQRIQRRLDTIRPQQVVQLKRIWSSINDGVSDIDAWFQPAPPQQQTQPPPTTGTEALRTALQQSLAKETESAASGSPADAADAAAVSPAVAASGGEEQPPAPPEAPPPARRPRQRATPTVATEPPAEPPAIAPAEPPVAIQQIKPKRRADDRGWDWETYADEYIATALKLPPSELGRFRGVQASMFEALRTSDREQWMRCNHTLADFERTTND